MPLQFDLDHANLPLDQRGPAIPQNGTGRGRLALDCDFLKDEFGELDPNCGLRGFPGPRGRPFGAEPFKFHGLVEEATERAAPRPPLLEAPDAPLTAEQRRGPLFRRASVALATLLLHTACAALVVAFGGRFEAPVIPEAPLMLVSFGALDGAGPAGAGPGEREAETPPTAPPLGEAPAPSEPDPAPSAEPVATPEPVVQPEPERLISPVKTAELAPETRKEAPKEKPKAPPKPKKTPSAVKPQPEPARAAESALAGAPVGSANGAPNGVQGGAGGGGLGKGDPDSPYVGEFGAGSGPSFLKQARPEYPSQAKRLSKEGVVVLRLGIDPAGALKKAEVIASAGSGFDEAALLAVRASQFRPAHRDGRPVASNAILRIKFQLAK